MNFIWWKIKNSKRLLFWFLNQNINLDHSANWILEKTLKCLMWHYLNIILHDFVQHVTWDFPGIHFGFTNLTSTSKLHLSIIVPFSSLWMPMFLFVLSEKMLNAAYVAVVSGSLSACA